MPGAAILTRRTMLQGLLIAAGAAGAGASAWVGQDSMARAVFDSRIPDSLRWRDRLALPSIDIARQHANLWKELRAFAAGGTVAGLTRWSDHVLARSLLQEKGLRLRFQAHRGSLYYWEMC